MDPAAIPPTPPQSATSPPPESCISSAAPPPFQLLEISLISAQDLPPISKSMQTHAVAWVTQTRKHTTRTDHKGHKNPTWNDKFIFPLDNNNNNNNNDSSVTAATLTVEIYTASWFRDVLVGTVKVPVAELVNPLTRAGNTRFVALQVRRPSGNPQGNLNIGVALLETTMRSMPLSLFPPPSNNKNINNIQKITKIEKQVENEEGVEYSKELHAKIHQWRSLSTGSSLLTNNEDNFPIKQGSMCNGSEICSDIGPSASIVAVELAKNHQQQQAHGHDGETGSSIVEELTVEEAKAKGYARVASRERWRKYDDVDHESSELLCDDNNGRRRRNSRRSSDGGLFSCLVYGIEFTIVCGTGNNNKSNSSSKKKETTNSEASTA